VTSRNFDAATAVATAEWRDRLPAGLVLEPGCGRGRVGEFLGLDPTRVVQMDNSLPMFALAGREPAMLRVLHDAEALPFPDEEFSADDYGRTHTVTVSVDPDNEVAESNEDNNQFTVTVEVPAQPGSPQSLPC
jgi:SAM-dependent methyltransferase